MSDVLTLPPDSNDDNARKRKRDTMPIIEFSDKDLLQGKVVEPAWYLMQIRSVGEAPSKDGGSTNYPVEGVIIKNSDTGGEAEQGVPIVWNFNSKAIGFAVGFLKAFGVDVSSGKRFELKMAEGKQLEVFVENDQWQGRMVNRVNHKYRPAR
jgi:hypothetical protein